MPAASRAPAYRNAIRNVLRGNSVRLTSRRFRITSRTGFTLLELILVLAIMVLLGALAVPRLNDVFERQKLNGAASDLRLAWEEARLQALRTGQAQVFECIVGTNEYSLKPLVLQSDSANAGSGATVMTGAGTLVEAQDSGYYAAADLSAAETKKLEEAISFLSCQVASDLRAYTVAQEAQSSGMGDVSTQSVSHQVIFYPDGSTSTAEVQIENTRGDVRAVRMRGLTGHSRIVALVNVASGTNDKTSSK